MNWQNRIYESLTEASTRSRRRTGQASVDPDITATERSKIDAAMFAKIHGNKPEQNKITREVAKTIAVRRQKPR